jgi:hypothetical protein
MYSIIFAGELSVLDNSSKLKARLLKWEGEAPNDIKEYISTLKSPQQYSTSEQSTGMDQVKRSEIEKSKVYAAVRLGNQKGRARGAILALLNTFKDRTSLKWEPGIGTRHLPTDPYTSPAKEAALALAQIGKEAIEPLIQAPKDKDWNVREMAAFTLGKIKDPTSVPYLIEAFTDMYGYGESKVVKWSDEKKTRKQLPEVAIWRIRSYPTRKRAAYALGEIKDPRAIDPLLEALGNDKSEGIRKEAADALRAITGENHGMDYQGWRNWWRSKNHGP